ncbi:MAG: hypothetical protein Q8O92_00070 [Candidatus Latescibacter sp.]|nr:hypothetical protein [Candidatus Latescibacter sp.]
MKTKDFDRVEMKRRGAEVLYKKLKTVTPEEQLAYWKASTAATIIPKRAYIGTLFFAEPQRS